jgi:hypothetical protein
MTRTRDGRLATLLVLIPALLALPARGDDEAEPLPPLNASVLEFARGHLGEKVGDGQCTAVAIEALKRAGARPYPSDDQGDGDYAWGTPVERPQDVRPGDVLQFRDATFQSRRRVRRGNRVAIHTSTRTFPHHTAVVEEVREGGKVLVILHQNTGPDDAPESERQVVQRDTLRMADLKDDGGWIKAYRPVAEGGSRRAP